MVGRRSESNQQHLEVGVYAGSLRPGGGLTSVSQILEGLASDPRVHVTVYTGANDLSKALQPLLRRLENVTERRFLPWAPATVRYVASKVLFLVPWKQFAWLLAINYHMLSSSPLAVYHLNLLSFLRGPADTIGLRMKRLDAYVACRRAKLNLFESQFLLDAAQDRLGGLVHNPAVLYLGVHPDFVSSQVVLDAARQVEGDKNGVERTVRSRVVMVSSPAPHKDNVTALMAFQRVCERRPEVDWKLTIAGGLSVEDWEPVRAQVTDLGIARRVEFLGPIDKKVLSALMRESLCLMSSSLVESFCMVALEAMASSCPAIVADTTSMPESVAGAAVVVGARDSDAFAAAVLAFYDDEAYRQAVIRHGHIRANAVSVGEFGRSLREALLL